MQALKVFASCIVTEIDSFVGLLLCKVIILYRKWCLENKQ
jgi:hypothetical protein